MFLLPGRGSIQGELIIDNGQLTTKGGEGREWRMENGEWKMGERRGGRESGRSEKPGRRRVQLCHRRGVGLSWRAFRNG
jgi:hypothetical protein